MEKERKEERMEERKEKGVVKMEKERKEERMEERKEKGVVKMEKERKEERMEERKEKGVVKMEKEVKEVVKEIEAKRGLLMEKVLQWALNLRPVRDIHVKVKGRYYPLIEKESGKLYVIDKVQGKKLPFGTLEDQMKFVIASVLAERKEEIEKEVEDGKRKYLEGRLQEINKLLEKF